MGKISFIFVERTYLFIKYEVKKQIFYFNITARIISIHIISKRKITNTLKQDSKICTPKQTGIL